MRIRELRIKRQESYESNPHQLLGAVTLESATGVQQYNLSNASIAEIFRVIKADVISTARQSANATSRALDDAAQEPLLIDAAEVGDAS